MELRLGLPPSPGISSHPLEQTSSAAIVKAPCGTPRTGSLTGRPQTIKACIYEPLGFSQSTSYGRHSCGSDHDCSPPALNLMSGIALANAFPIQNI